MNKTIIGIWIAVILITLVIGISIFLELYTETSNFYNDNQLTAEQQECEHTFVTVSKYIAGRYRVYSRCVKCGLEIK